jgi:hypothetical protein
MNSASVTDIATHQSCRQCGESKPSTLEFFYAKNAASGRLDSTCRDCRCEDQKKVRRQEALRRSPRVRATGPTKRCTGCGETKASNEFYKATNRPGVTPLCKECSSERANERQQRMIRESWAKRMLVYAYRNRLKRRGIHDPCDFDVPYLVELYARQLGRCWWTGIELNLEMMGKLDSVSLDRLNNDKGYLKGNVVLVTRAVNLARNTASPEEIADYIQKIREV